MRRFSRWLERQSKGWLVLVGLAIFAGFLGFVLPQQAQKSQQYSADVGSPDSSLFYSADDLYRFAEAYGPEGRAEYVAARFSFDLIWPLAYTLFLATAISWLGQRAFADGSNWRLLNLVPVIGLGLDYAENCGAALVMGRYPERTPIIDWLTPWLSASKWLFVNGSFVVLVAVGLVYLWQRIKKHRSNG
ncbi:hypothetical protein [Herpetosiphon sp. NSE202]|uniref:hypothetical protein n=1 Tax=Herpetosiphon sp. NSE202 TaxID=3351349 RepID=UPI003642AF84